MRTIEPTRQFKREAKRTHPQTLQGDFPDIMSAVAELEIKSINPIGHRDTIVGGEAVPLFIARLLSAHLEYLWVEYGRTYMLGCSDRFISNPANHPGISNKSAEALRLRIIARILPKHLRLVPGRR